MKPAPGVGQPALRAPPIRSRTGPRGAPAHAVGDQFGDEFDADDRAGCADEPRRQSGRPPRPGPDVEHALTRADVEQAQHVGDRPRLRVGGAVPDRQRPVGGGQADVGRPGSRPAARRRTSATLSRGGTVRPCPDRRRHGPVSSGGSCRCAPASARSALSQEVDPFQHDCADRSVRTRERPARQGWTWSHDKRVRPHFHPHERNARVEERDGVWLIRSAEVARQVLARRTPRPRPASLPNRSPAA